MTNYNLDQPEDKIVDQVIGRLETYLFTQGVSVELGVNGRQIIEDLVFQYGVEATKQYDEIGHLSADLETANSCLAEYTKLFGDILDANKIKTKYQQMLKKEMAHHE